MMAALQNFRNMTVKKKMLILGDMRELGVESAAEHRKIVDFLQECLLRKSCWLENNLQQLILLITPMPMHRK